MTGALDEVKIWNRTLTRDEIREQRHLDVAPIGGGGGPGFGGLLPIQ